MKALEKAAKDRDDARQEAPATATAAASAGSELTLEPLAPEGTGAQPQAAEPGGTAREHAQAAAVVQAGARSRPMASESAAPRPLVVVGVIALLIAIAFGVYVALQILGPSPLTRQTPLTPKAPLPPLSQAPAPAAAPAVAPTPAPLPAAAVLPPDVPSAPGTSSPIAPPVAAPAPAPAPRRTASPQRDEPAPERGRIVVSRGSAEPVMNPLLPRAYAALQANRLAEAREFYERLRRAEPRNIDALLGLAQIEVLEGNSDEATKHYFQILELEPRNPFAQSGLIALLGGADPIAAETRLKSLIAQEPSAYLYFTLGNLYADQAMWPAAQQAYFQAYHLEPSNPDYAYNLAVGLEHVGQPKPALGFYRRAAELAAAKGHTHFNLAQAQQRISELASRVK